MRTVSEAQKGISHRLYMLRLENDMSQDDLAKAIGVAKSTIWRWEKGAHYMPAEYVSRLCKTLGCTMEHLLEGTEERK